MNWLPEAGGDRVYALYLTATLTRTIPIQMITVAVGWQVYAINRSTAQLGIIGLLEFLPLLLLAIPAGHVADMTSRKLMLAVACVVAIADAVGLLLVTLDGAKSFWPFMVLALVSGASLAIGQPAARALAIELVVPEQLSGAIALRSIVLQIGTIAGPALGGPLFAAGGKWLYVVAVVLFGASLGCTLAIRYPAAAAKAPPARTSFGDLIAGIAFVRRSRTVLAAILLDLFAVLFGGAVALLPAYARSILDVGPAGLGLLRSAPAIGSLLAGALLARWHSHRRSGPTLLIVVLVFGLSTIAFGLSRSFALSMVMLALGGFADLISMNIRAAIVGFATPARLRTRVTSVEMIFISASNQLGAFESGMTAALLGTVPAVVAGGIATVLIAAVWTGLFPTLARLDRPEHLQPERELATV